MKASTSSTLEKDHLAAPTKLASGRGVAGVAGSTRTITSALSPGRRSGERTSINPPAWTVTRCRIAATMTVVYRPPIGLERNFGRRQRRLRRSADLGAE